MFYVVCYDIADDQRRELIAKRLKDFGTRIQQSVFECLLDDAGYSRMMTRLQREKLDQSDKVRVYRLCAKCVSLTEIYGPGELTTDEPFYLV